MIDENEAGIANATINIKNAVSGFASQTQTDERGEFDFNNLPFATYQFKAEKDGFAAQMSLAEVRSNIPLQLKVKLRVAAAHETVKVAANAELIDKNLVATEIRIDANRISQAANAVRGRGLQKTIANVPGAATQNNGLVHIRGVDDGLLYIVDGVPTTDRVDAISASSFDNDDISSLNIITGNFPAEFGGRNGAIVQIQPKSGIDEKLFGSLAINNGNFRTRDAQGSFGGSIKNKFGVYLSSATSLSDHYLDPVDERNFNNRGNRLHFNLRGDWQPTTKDIFILSAGANGTNFRVPNDFTGEIAGQRQQQKLRDNNQAIS